MNRTTPSWIRCVPGVRFVVALAALSLSACYESETIKCSSGLVCPTNTTCSADGLSCLTDSCGDSIRQAAEACDDGNKIDGDGCSANCMSTERCGNNFIDRSVGEVCDEGDTVAGDGCSADCKSKELCGNGIRDLAIGEVCDDGNKADGDNCSANCRSTEACGNGITDFAAGEICDDGNKADGDKCNSSCDSVADCGNGTRDIGEECDDGNDIETDDCLNDCKFAWCGDGNIKATGRAEQCDDAGESATCNRNCKLSSCGDGIVNLTAGEQCDMNGRDTQTCTSQCKVSFCGDGYINLQGGEECDYKKPDGLPGCLNTCKFDECGDGETQTEDGEVCDDGNRDDCGTCNATCTVDQSLAKATGSIEVVENPPDGETAGLALKDGWKFTISDGRNLPRGFEFDKSGAGNVTPGYQEVQITNAMNSIQVAGAIFYAIRDAGSLRVDASYPGQRTVSLEHDNAGVSGNQLIIGAPQDQIYDILKISGMSGGVARNCPLETSCKSTDDCAPSLSCKGTPKACRP